MEQINDLEDVASGKLTVRPWKSPLIPGFHTIQNGGNFPASELLVLQGGYLQFFQKNGWEITEAWR